MSGDAKDYRPGDLVTWNLDPSGSTPHIGIAMPRRTSDGACFDKLGMRLVE